MSKNKNKNEIIIYQSQDGKVKIDCRMEKDTLWLNQAQISELFGRERSVITKHIQNVFDENEISKESNVQNLHIANSDKPDDLTEVEKAYLQTLKDMQKKLKAGSDE